MDISFSSQEVFRRLDYEKENEVGVFNLIGYKLYLEINRDFQKNFIEKWGEKLINDFIVPEIKEDVIRFKIKFKKIIDDEITKITGFYKSKPDVFNYTYGWFDNVGSLKRHEITNEELMKDMIRFYEHYLHNYLEEKLPTQYR